MGIYTFYLLIIYEAPRGLGGRPHRECHCRRRRGVRCRSPRRLSRVGAAAGGEGYIGRRHIGILDKAQKYYTKVHIS